VILTASAGAFNAGVLAGIALDNAAEIEKTPALNAPADAVKISI